MSGAAAAAAALTAKQEVAAIQTFMTNIAKASTKEEKKEILLQFLPTFLKLDFMYTHKNFRVMLRKQINEQFKPFLLDNPQAILTLTNIERRLNTYNSPPMPPPPPANWLRPAAPALPPPPPGPLPAWTQARPAFPPPPAASASAPVPVAAIIAPSIQNRTVLGRGSYGCVVDPALPNLAADGSWTSYPGNVTKLFKDKRNYESAVRKSQVAYNVLGRQENQRFNPYSYNKWKFNKLSAAAKEKCKTSYGRAYPLRMPNLGVSLVDAIEKNPDVKAHLASLNPAVIVAECIRMIENVRTIYTAGYIHGDIRETNVMIHPETGHMALIDFDWLYPIDQFKREYRDGFGFYNNPPEALFMHVVRHGMAMRWEDIGPEMEDEVNKYFKIHQDLGIISPVTTIDGFLNMLEPARYMLSLKPADRREDDLFQMMAPSFDSFGLGMTLMYFLKNLYEDVGMPALVSQFLASVVMPSMKIKMAERKSIAAVYADAQAFKARLGGAKAGTAESKAAAPASAPGALAAAPAAPGYVSPPSPKGSKSRKNRKQRTSRKRKTRSMRR